MTLEIKSYTDSALSDLFKEFFNGFKENNAYKYADLIKPQIIQSNIIEIDYNDFNDELKNILKNESKERIHSAIYRAVSEFFQSMTSSGELKNVQREDMIKIKILNLDGFEDVIDGTIKQNKETTILFDQDKDEKLSSTLRVHKVGQSIIEKQVKSENDTEQIVIKVRLNDKPHWIDIRSPTFEQMIRVKTQDIYQEIYSDSTYKTAIKNLYANALLNGTETKPIFSRSAFVDECLYYDLQNLDGVVFKISKDEIKKTQDNDSSPIFLKSPSAKTFQSMQQEPSFDNPNALNEFVNLCRIQDSDRVVFVSHFISFFLKCFPIPIQILHGEQGSAKTSVSSAIKGMIDPEGENALSLPENVDDLAIVLSKRDLSNFDNTDNFTKEISQFLCKAVTGTQYGKRGLYTNDEEFSLTLMSKIILNGIDPSIKQPDLLERSIFYELPKIDKTERMTDEDFKIKVNNLKPSLLGIIFETIQNSMNIIEDVKKELKGSSLPRMASFAIWGESISRALGNDDNDFINRYWEMIEDVSLSLNEEYPLIPLVVDLMKRNCKLDENQKPIQQPKTILLSELFNVLLLDGTKDKRLPADSKVLGKQLKQLKPTFRTLDYEISVTKYNKRDEKYPRGSNIVSIIPIASNGLDQFG